MVPSATEVGDLVPTTTDVGDVLPTASEVGDLVPTTTEVGDVVPPATEVDTVVTAAVGSEVGAGLTFPGSTDGPGVGSPTVVFAVGADVAVEELAGLCVGGHSAL